MAEVRSQAKQLVKLLEKFPSERIKHVVSFKQTQLARFKALSGLEQSTGGQDASSRSLDDIRDMIKRTSGPLGLQKELFKKLQDGLPNEKFTEQNMQQQIKSLQAIMGNKYRDYYNVGDKLYRPQGNPTYYERILNELTGKKKETLLSAFRTIVFGK